MNNKVIASVLTAFCVVGCVCAGVVPGRWEKVQAESPGTQIIVKLTSGEEIEGTYQELGDQALLMTVDGAPRNIPKSGIAKITTAEKRQGSVWKGAVIGAAAGGAISSIFVARHYDSYDSVGMWWCAIPLSALGGAAAGILVDNAFKGPVTLYEAPRQ